MEKVEYKGKSMKLKGPTVVKIRVRTTKIAKNNGIRLFCIKIELNERATSIKEAIYQTMLYGSLASTSSKCVDL